MFGLGTIVKTIAIIAGGVLGGLFGKFLKERHQDSLCKVCGICTLFIGIAGALEGMLTVEGSSVPSGNTLLIIGCLSIGSILIFCVGLNLVWDKRIRVANLLPSIIIAVVAALI